MFEIIGYIYLISWIIGIPWLYWELKNAVDFDAATSVALDDYEIVSLDEDEED